MSDRAAHLSDDEIDGYWRGMLSPSGADRVEQHFLDCLDCRNRVSAVEELVRGLDPGTGLPAQGIDAADSLRVAPAVNRPFVHWPVAASIAAAAGLAAAWFVGSWTLEGGRGRPASTIVADQAAGTGPVVISLVPPTRGSEQTIISVPATGIVLFVLDAREAVGTRGRATVTLLGSDRLALVTLRDVGATNEGAVRLPVDAEMVAPGRYEIDVTGPSGIASFPFVVTRPQTGGR